MIMSDRSYRSLLVQIPLLVSAIEKYFQGQTLTLNSVQISVADATKILQSYAAGLTATLAAHSKWGDVLSSTRRQAPAATTLIQDLGDYVRAMYGNSNVVLGEFGMAPRKRAKATVATKQEAIAKSAATRVARHTAGPKQKAKIHGEAPAPPELKPK
jgi:hypothetical protein